VLRPDGWTIVSALGLTDAEGDRILFLGRAGGSSRY
jgi:hypothetical protein